MFAGVWPMLEGADLASHRSTHSKWNWIYPVDSMMDDTRPDSSLHVISGLSQDLGKWLIANTCVWTTVWMTFYTCTDPGLKNPHSTDFSLSCSIFANTSSAEEVISQSKPSDDPHLGQYRPFYVGWIIWPQTVQFWMHVNSSSRLFVIFDRKLFHQYLVTLATNLTFSYHQYQIIITHNIP